MLCYVRLRVKIMWPDILYDKREGEKVGWVGGEINYELRMRKYER